MREKSEVRSQRSGVRGQKSEVRICGRGHRLAQRGFTLAVAARDRDHRFARWSLMLVATRKRLNKTSPFRRGRPAASRRADRGKRDRRGNRAAL
jgi:hypothetical protein